MKKEFEKLKVMRVFIKQPCESCGRLPEDKWYIRNPVYGEPAYMCPRCYTQICRAPFSEDLIEMGKDWCIVEYTTTLSRWFKKKEEQTRFVISSVKERKEGEKR